MIAFFSSSLLLFINYSNFATLDKAISPNPQPFQINNPIAENFPDSHLIISFKFLPIIAIFVSNFTTELTDILLLLFLQITIFISEYRPCG